MNRKQLLILIVVAAVLGGAGWVLWKKNSQVYTPSSSRLGSKLIADFPINDVAQITIRQNTNEVNLVRSEGGDWQVKERDNFPAKVSSIGDFLRKVWEMKVTKPVKIGESRLPKLELLPPPEGKGTLVEFRDADGKVLHTLLLGTEHMREAANDSQFGGGSWPDGRYVMLNSDINKVSLISEPLGEIKPTPSQWLKTDFFKIENASTLQVQFPTDEDSWKLTRETQGGSWALADPKEKEELDSSKISAMANPFSYPSFTDVKVATDENLKEAGLDKPTVISIDTFDGFSYEIKVGEKTGSNYHLAINVDAKFPEARTPKPDESDDVKTKLDKEFKDKQDTLKEKLAKEDKFEGWIFEVPAYAVDSIIKKRSDLLKKEEEKKPEETETNSTPASAEEN